MLKIITTQIYTMKSKNHIGTRSTFYKLNY